MWGQVVVGVLIVTGLGLAARTSTEIRHRQESAQSVGLANNMMVYAQHVKAYARANPTVIGPVADSSLGLPGWYTKALALQNYVNAGAGYVYTTGPGMDLAHSVVIESKYRLPVGINTSGTLLRPHSSTNSSHPISIPSAIPSGSIVIAP